MLFLISAWPSSILDISEAETGVYVMLPGKTQQITHQTGTIVSHREYPHKKYPNYVDSTLWIEIPANEILLFTVTVTNFELESRSRWSGRCSDYLEINGQKYCGSELAFYNIILTV